MTLGHGPRKAELESRTLMRIAISCEGYICIVMATDACVVVVVAR